MSFVEGSYTYVNDIKLAIINIHLMINLRLFVVLFVAMFSGVSCSKQESHMNYQSELIRIERVTNHIFIHESFLETQTWGKVGCNGMVFIKNGEAIIFDAPTNDAASDELLAWLGSKVKVKGVVVNHFHDDCLGGLKALHQQGIPSYAHSLTISLARNDSLILDNYIPQNAFEKVLELTVGGETIFNQYFGRGHTHDNVVSYVPSEHALFGGCLVKSMGASKGHLADADTIAWSATVENVILAFPEVDIVVPGHGPHGDVALLHYTSRLFEVKTEKE